ncbi:MAG: SDR family NAD(P)-dependent oxidoreductase [Bacteroidetes bacterium]|nr:SDR family NAD(P)-dependent oxidoreductase [Bacteroidota bacterium]
MKILIIGATSGIGRELARLYAGQGHTVGVTGRRNELLYSLQLEYPNHIFTACFDTTAPGATTQLERLVTRMGGLDLLLYNAGWGEPSESLDYEIDKGTVDINVNAFLEAIHFGWQYFTAQGHGHLAATSSIASNRGNRITPAYSAAKSFQSTYLEGLHIKALRTNPKIYVTDIQPGFVDTKMAKGPRFWVASPQKAARQIKHALDHHRWRVYITRRWWIIAKLFKYIPSWLYHRLG